MLGVGWGKEIGEYSSKISGFSGKFNTSFCFQGEHRLIKEQLSFAGDTKKTMWVGPYCVIFHISLKHTAQILCY